MTENTKTQLLYLLNFLDVQIERLISNVLADSIEDPQFSAVTTMNLIKCYIKVMQELGVAISYANVGEYMAYNCYTDDEINSFYEKAKKESAYYVGKQY